MSQRYSRPRRLTPHRKGLATPSTAPCNLRSLQMCVPGRRSLRPTFVYEEVQLASERARRLHPSPLLQSVGPREQPEQPFRLSLWRNPRGALLPARDPVRRTRAAQYPDSWGLQSLSVLLPESNCSYSSFAGRKTNILR